MNTQPLSPDELLSTTRSVRKRLDLQRPRVATCDKRVTGAECHVLWGEVGRVKRTANREPPDRAGGDPEAPIRRTADVVQREAGGDRARVP